MHIKMSLSLLCFISTAQTIYAVLSLRFNGHFPGVSGLAGTRMSPLSRIGAKGDGGGGDNWSYKTCKAPVISLPTINQHPVFYRLDALPVAQPTVSDH